MTELPPPPPGLLDGAALFLDFDGTLVSIADRHDAVVADDGLVALVPALARALEGRVAVVSGRSADEILTYLAAPRPAPGFTIAGSHGLEFLRPDGRLEAPDRPPELDRVLAEARAVAAGLPGVVVEAKPFGFALHYRLAPEHQAECDALGERLAAAAGLHVQRGKMVCEVRLAGADKGDAVRRLLALPPMAEGRPVFVGDDLTDEAGFRAAREAGGAGVLVGTRDGTAACFALPDVGAVRRWLAATVAGNQAEH